MLITLHFLFNFEVGSSNLFQLGKILYINGKSKTLNALAYYVHHQESRVDEKVKPFTYLILLTYLGPCNDIYCLRT